MQLQQQEFTEGDRTNTVLGRGLGVFSVGLGLAEVAAPHMVAKLIGVEDRGATLPMLRAFGAREMATGIGLLAKPQASLGPWARVLGDLLDLAFLGWAVRDKSYARARTIGAFAAVAGVAAIDAYAGIRRRRRLFGKPVRRSITIARTPDEVYRAWRDFKQLPEFMTWVESVEDLDERCSHWRVRTPVGAIIEYDAELVEDIPGQRIAWRSMPGATVPNRGQVTFAPAPGGRGTEVVLEMRVAAPLAKTIAGAEAQGDLHRFKQIMEVGEVLYSDASVHRGPHPARPSEGGV